MNTNVFTDVSQRNGIMNLNPPQLNGKTDNDGHGEIRYLSRVREVDRRRNPQIMIQCLDSGSVNFVCVIKFKYFFNN